MPDHAAACQGRLRECGIENDRRMDKHLMDQLLPYYFTPDIDCGVRVAQTIGTGEIYRYMESQKLSRRKERRE